MRRAPLLCLAAMLLALPSGADVLETRDGRVLEGTYLGGTQQAVRFQAGDAIEVFLIEELRALRFTRPTPEPAAGNGETPAPPAATAANTTAAAPPGPARVPAGTALRVRMLDGIDSRTAAAGDRFAATLEMGLGADGVAVVPAGSKLYGRIAELRATGPIPSRLKLELTQLMLGGELLDIVTGSQQLAATSDAGPASASTIPARPGFTAGAVLEFRLLQPFAVRIAR